MVTHYLDCGVHGFVLCHAETPGAVKALIESMRFPFNDIGVGDGLDVGRRGRRRRSGSISGDWIIQNICGKQMSGPSIRRAS